MTTANTIRLDQLDARIRSVWTRSQTLHLLAGALAVVRWAIPLFLIGVFIDWMTYMPVAGRIVILLTIVGVSLYRGWACGWRYLRPFDAVRTALQLESHHGDLNSLLVSAIQLRGQADGGKQSSALSEHTCKLAEAAAADVQPQQAVPFAPLKRPGIITAIFVGIIAVFATVNGPFFAAGLTRIFTPWVDAEYPTHTQITLDQEELIIKEGDPAAITAQLAGVIPDEAVIYVRTGEGRARAIDLEVIDGVSTYEIASASRDFTYRIKAGDDRTDWHDVRVVPAPRIEAVQVELAYPDYLQRDAETIEALTVTVPEGTDLNWRLTLDRPIQSAAFVRDGQAPIELTVGSDGKTIAFTEDVPASLGYQFTWVDQEHGYEFTSPRYFLQVAADQAPRIELTSPVTNLVAMLGRPMELAVRVQDDHGIDTTQVAYRVNQFDEKKLDLPKPVQIGQGEQPIDWDYRQTLPDLQIGDSVSFAVKVSDRYPGDEGPHVVRSETRRITFLSKEQYLEQIEKQRDRLLSRVQTIYRQQRAAHEVVRALSPVEEGYRQACQLESIRQAMARDQIAVIAEQMQALLDDLAANNVADASQGAALESVRAALVELTDQHIEKAITLLRDQSAIAAKDAATNGPVEAASEVNAAARELGSLVLLRGITAAQEVYAREARMLAQEQAALRWLSLTTTSSEQSLSLVGRQNEIAQWTESLTADLQAGMRYDKRPLAVLRLIRSVKDLREAGTIEQMQAAAKLINQKQGEQAAAIQADLVRTLLDAEFSVRLSGAYTMLLKTRDLIGSLAAVQNALRQNSGDLSAADFDTQRVEIGKIQTALRKQLLTMLLPTVPAPRADLFDETPPQAPPIDAMLAKADQAMTQALAQLQSGDQQAVVAHQLEANQALSQLLLTVQRWSVEFGLQAQGLSTLVAASSDRISRLEDFEARTIGLLEKTDLAAAEEQNINSLAESQLILAEDLAGYIETLEQQNQSEPDQDLPPMLSRLDGAEQALNAAVQALKDNDADQAIGYQEQAADALAEAYAIVVAQNERLAMLQSLLLFQRSVGLANGHMADIVAEQRDLLEATEAAKPEAMAVMLPQFGHMRDSIYDVAPLLNLVAARLDVGTPLAFAQTDFEDAMAALESGDQFEAIDAQDVAAESLATVQGLVAEIREQTGYVAEIVNFLHVSVADAGTIAHEQNELRRELGVIEQDALQRFVEAQQALLSQAAKHHQQLTAAAGSPGLIPPFDPLVDLTAPTEPVPVLNDPTQAMQEALAALKDNDAAAAAEAMELAELIYAENAEALLTVITMLRGLPEVAISSATEPELVRLVDALAVASDQKQLFRQTQIADDAALEALGKQQQAIASRLGEIAANGEPHLMLTDASKHLSDAAAALQPLNRAALTKHQRAADETLRHFIVEQALILETDIPPPAPSDADATDGPGSDSESEVAAGLIADFVSGETPSDKRAEWQVLAERNRAALNQNFARELPLEYRGLLKNYYERVAK